MSASNASPKDRFNSLVSDLRSTHVFSKSLKEDVIELMVRSYELGVAAGKLEALAELAKAVGPA